MNFISQRHHLKFDILVAGGGVSGVSCALAAARQGAKVLMVQDRSVLGGNASSEVRMHIVGANSARPSGDLVLEARESGIIEEIRLENSFRNPQRSPSMFDLILYEKCRAEPGLTVMLNTSVVAARTEDGVIKEVVAHRNSTEDEFLIEAKIFVDCTGDGGLGVAAGAAFMRGREERARFGESRAQQEADEKTLGSTLLMMGRKHDKPMPFIAPPWARKFTDEDLRLRPHGVPGIDSGLEYGFWWMEWGGQLDTIKDNETIRDELLAIVMGMWDHIKNHGDHGAENWALDWFGAVPGKRESRRFIGQHILTEQDLLESRPHSDAIAYGGWPLDLHPPEGIDKSDEPPTTCTEVPFLYDIPLRSCIARDVKNLMFAGRNISATHVAFASTRVMATCSVVGEGVGMSAAYAVEKNLMPAVLPADPVAMEEIRQRLLREDAYLTGATFQGKDDLVYAAALSASSEKPGGEARNILSGQTRAVQGERSLPVGREIPGTHRWMSEDLPSWIELAWSEAVEVGTVEIIFDTGLHRHLTLTQSDAYSQIMCWGTGQPECVKDYRIEIWPAEGPKHQIDVQSNWQRRRKHALEKTLKSQRIRITVLAAWGIDHARIMRVGVFSETPGGQPSSLSSRR